MYYDIDRFVEMHELYYPIALAEIKDGHKRSHWMWYIFPQLKGLGHSQKSKYYGLSNIEEVKEYMNNEYLKSNLIFGYPDNLKLLSSMTLFDYVFPNIKIFKSIIDKFYNGEKDNITIAYLKDN